MPNKINPVEFIEKLSKLEKHTNSNYYDQVDGGLKYISFDAANRVNRVVTDSIQNFAMSLSYYFEGGISGESQDNFDKCMEKLNLLKRTFLKYEFVTDIVDETIEEGNNLYNAIFPEKIS